MRAAMRKREAVDPRKYMKQKSMRIACRSRQQGDIDIREMFVVSAGDLGRGEHAKGGICIPGRSAIFRKGGKAQQDREGQGKADDMAEVRPPHSSDEAGESPWSQGGGITT